MLNSIAFYILAVITLAGAVAALTLRNLVHCALCVAASFAGIALIYLQLDAEFVGFAQILVYIGAVAILVLFTVLLTRGTEVQAGVAFLSRSWPAGLAVTALVFAAIAAPILLTPELHKLAADSASAPVRKIGEELMGNYVLPLEVIGLLLTSALLGAVVIAMQDKKDEPETPENAKDLKPTGEKE